MNPPLKAVAVVALGLFLSSSVARAGCQVYLGENEWNYEGYVIHYGDAVAEVLQSKGYQLTALEPDADFRVSLKMAPVDGSYFQYASARYEWMSNRGGPERLSARDQKRCLTQLCGVADFVPPIRKVLARMKSDLPVCH